MPAHASKGITFVPKMPRLLGHAPSITSSSTVLDVALTVFGNSVDFGPELPASGAAPPAYNVTDSAGSFGTTVPPFSFSTGVLVHTASGDTATAAGTASSSLASLNITAGTFSLSPLQP
jgi:hypothetical protein